MKGNLNPVAKCLRDVLSDLSAYTHTKSQLLSA